MPEAESPFVGADRVVVVDRLLATFDQVVSTLVPRWVSLEAPSGWGKTRLIHELFRRLAAERQDAGAYWPRSILDAVAPDGRASLETPDGRRKRIFPEHVSPAEDALPSWMWLGIGCAFRAGTPFQALANDLTQFEAHERGLEDRWRRDASAWARLKRAATGDKAKEAADTGVGELVGAAAEALGAGVPGLGFVLLVGKWGIRSLRRRGEGDDDPGYIDAAGTGRMDIVEELAPALAQIARQIVPLVVVVEDLHLADESLVEVLRRLLAHDDARVLVVTTAWSGLLDETGGRAHRLIEAVDPDRTVRLRAVSDDGAPELLPLDDTARQVLVRSCLPNAPAAVVDAIVDRYANPLAVELVASYAPLREALALGTDAVAVVTSLPTKIRDLYYAMWLVLPESVQTMLMLAALASPAAIHGPAGGGDEGWDDELLREGVGAVDWLAPYVAELDGHLEAVATSYAWVRLVDEWLRRFHEPVQRDTALGLGQERFPHEHRRPLYQAIAARTRLDDGFEPGRRLHHARVMLALEAEGFVEPDDRWLDAAVVVCQWLAGQPDVSSARESIVIAERAVAARLSPDSGPMLTIRLLFADALGASGRVADAVDQCTALLPDCMRLLGNDHPDTLSCSGSLGVWLGRAGRLDAAIGQLRQVLAEHVRVLGEDHSDTLMVRNTLAVDLARAGRLDDAIDQFTRVVADRSRVLGRDHPSTLDTRSSLAACVAQAGGIEEAAVQLESLLADLTRVLGPDHPATLSTRVSLVSCLGSVGHVTGAIDGFTQLLADQTRVLGREHPDTLTTRMGIGYWLTEAGQVAEAIDHFTQLLADETQILGGDHPATLTTRSNLAWALGQAGHATDAVDQFTQLLRDRTRVLGADHPDTLITRNNLAWHIGSADRPAEAVGAFTRLRGDMTRVLGADHPDTLKARNNLARFLGESGRVDDAIDECTRLLTDRTRVLGPDHPDTLMTRDNLAAWRAEAERQAGGGAGDT